jgi:predicted N-formylglutamate amidohydrolase
MTHLLFTCEHGGYEIPPAYRRCFRGAQAVLKSHRGWDPGALALAKQFAAKFSAPLYFSTVSRLLVELNRSVHHRALFSSYTRGLPADQRQAIVDEFYRPHREAVERHIAEEIELGHRVMHIGVHTFTPALDGKVRTADIGLLYDPSRVSERTFCQSWRRQLSRADSSLRVRMNYPYRGVADGFTTYLRAQFSNARYAGIELEVNQRFPLGAASRWKAVRRSLMEAIDSALPEA